MSEYDKGRKDASTNYFLWMCRYNTSILSLRKWLVSCGHSGEYIDGYIDYMGEYSQ